MVGVIRARDIWLHPFTTIHCFGWQVFFQAVNAGSESTFLSLLGETSFFRSADAEATDIVRRCIDLELRAKHIYEKLCETFANRPAVVEFFSVLADQEQEHADLLRLCMVASRRSGWKHVRFAPWRDYLPHLERRMLEAESAAAAIESLEDALQLVVQLESSEINLVFRGALAASNSPFAHRLAPFRTAVETHLNYIVTQITNLAPHLTMISRELRARFPQMV